MTSDNIVDTNYNTRVTLENGDEYLMFADRLHTENLDHWKGWHCAAVMNYLIIDPKLDVYGSRCRNDFLGNLENNFTILDDYTICKRDRCVFCTADLMISKFRPE